MATRGLEGIDETVRRTHEWIGQIAYRLGSDQHYAYQSLRGVLHALRDRLSIDESAQLSAQLPMLIRGIYFEGWDPCHRVANRRDSEAFLALACGRAQPGQAEAAIRAVAGVVECHVSAGEWSHVLAQLPRRIRDLVDEGAHTAPAVA